MSSLTFKKSLSIVAVASSLVTGGSIAALAALPESGHPVMLTHRTTAKAPTELAELDTTYILPSKIQKASHLNKTEPFIGPMPCTPLDTLPSGSSIPYCGRSLLPKSYFYMHRGVWHIDLKLFPNRTSQGAHFSKDGKYKKYRDFSGHRGGYWKITTNNGQALHTTDINGAVIPYGVWGPYPYSLNLHTMEHQS